MSGPAGAASFCRALTALYVHMAELPHVVSGTIAREILSDYVSYAPTVIGAAPPPVQSSASLYMRTVAGYLQALVRADLNQSRLPAGALEPLASPSVNQAFTQLSEYSRTQCQYAIGGTPTGSEKGGSNLG